MGILHTYYKTHTLKTARCIVSLCPIYYNSEIFRAKKTKKKKKPRNSSEFVFKLKCTALKSARNKIFKFKVYYCTKSF